MARLPQNTTTHMPTKCATKKSRFSQPPRQRAPRSPLKSRTVQASSSTLRPRRMPRSRSKLPSIRISINQVIMYPSTSGSTDPDVEGYMMTWLMEILMLGNLERERGIRLGLNVLDDAWTVLDFNGDLGALCRGGCENLDFFVAHFVGIWVVVFCGNLAIDLYDNFDATNKL